MKMKQILAGVLTAAMVLTSAPVAGLNVSAAETTEGSTVISAPALSMSTAPAIGGNTAACQIAVAGAQEVVPPNKNTTYTNEAYNVTGSTPFLIKFRMKVNTAPTLTEQLILEHPNYKIKIGTNKLYFFAQVDNASNSQAWAESEYTFNDDHSLADFVGVWHDIIAAYQGNKFVFLVDGVAGTPLKANLGTFDLKSTESSNIVLGNPNIDMIIDEFEMYSNLGNLDLSTMSSADAVNQAIAEQNLTAAATEVPANGSFYAGNTIWKKDGAAVTAFDGAGDYTAEIVLTAKDGFTFSTDSVPTSITVGESTQEAAATVSEDGTTMTVTTTVTFTATEYAQPYITNAEKLLEKNAFSEESTATVTEAKNALQTAVDNNSDDIEAKITALKTAIKEADITMSRRYAEPVVGEAIPMTEDDRLFYDNANTLTIDFVYKFNTVPASSGNARALFTLSNKTGQYITLWHNPTMAGDKASTGAISISGSDIATGLFFSSTSGWKTTDTNWHKISISFSKKNSQLYITKDNSTVVTDFNLGSGNWLNNAYNPLMKLLDSHEWQVEEILVGKKATNGTYVAPNNVTTVSDVAITNGNPEIQVKYVGVSAKTCSSTTDITDVRNTLDDVISAERDALVAEKDKVLSTCYTTDTWRAYENACTTASVATTDWAMLNAIDALKTAKKALVKESGFKEVALTLGGKIGVNFRTDDLNAVSAVFTMGEKTLTSKETADANGNTVYTCEVAAKEMADTITAVLKDADGNIIDQMEKSVAEYAKGYLAEDSRSSTELQNLVKSMLHYGAAAQTQFNYNTENLADAGIEAATPSIVGLDAYASDVPNGSGYNAFSLILESDTTLRLYFDGTVSTDSIVVQKQGTEVETVKGVKGNRNYVSIPNIAANNLNDVYTITVGDTPAGTCSALAYCYKALNSDQATDSLRNVVTALYQYSTDADDYERSLSASN